jgi:hypothetical protein
MNNLIAVIFLCLPIVFLVTLFIGIIKKRKRLWVTSLIFLIIVSFVDIALFTALPGKKIISTQTIQKSNTVKN